MTLHALDLHTGQSMRSVGLPLKFVDWMAAHFRGKLIQHLRRIDPYNDVLIPVSALTTPIEEFIEVREFLKRRRAPDIPKVVERLSAFFRFFHGPNLRTILPTSAMYARAAAIRGGHTYPVIPPAQPKLYGLVDALHLATAVESGCDVFLTNDDQLANFPHITVEKLP